MGKVKVINGHLSLVIPIEISHIQPHIENINSVLGTIMYYCNKTKEFEDSQCENIINPLTSQFQNMIKEYSSITHLIDGRSKRGAWFGGIGTAFKHIFGTLDEDDAIKYDSAISQVQDDQKRIASLVKEHILVTRSTLTRFNETIHRLRSNEDNLNLAIDKLSVKLKDLSNKTDHLSAMSGLNTIYNNLEASILTLSFQIEDITNAILFSNVNVIHPSVITPQEFYKELTDNYRYLPSELEFVTPLELKLIHIIMNSSKLISYYLNKKIMFILMVPLTNPLEFYLYNNIPLPVPHNVSNPNSFSVIIPNSKYIAITKDKTHYCSINDIEICKNFGHQSYLCKIMNIFPTSANPNCESELLSRVVSSLPTYCKSEFINGNLDVWKPLRNNRWIFVQSKSSKLTIDCLHSELVDIKILGTGIVHIPIHCKAYCRNTKLLPDYNVLNITLPLVNLDFNLVKDPCCSFGKFKQVADSLPLLKLNNLDLHELSSTQNLDKEIIQDFNKIINQPHIIKYGAHYSALTIFFIVIIILFCIFKLFKRINITGSLHRQKQTPKITFTKKTRENNDEIKNRDQDIIELSNIEIEPKNINSPSSPKIRMKL